MFKKRRGGKSNFKRRPGKGVKGRKPRPMLGLMPSVDNVQKAVMVETFQPTPTIAPNTAYGFTTTISNFPRALKMAQLFKFYRLKRVIYECLPDQTTFQAGAGAVNIPYVYYVMNRDGMAQTGLTPAQYKAAGARPIKFTQKILIAYKPNTVQISDVLLASSIPIGSNNNTTIGRTPVYDKWYSTQGILAPNANYVAPTVDRSDGSVAPFQQIANNLSIVQYFGHDIFFEQQGGAAETELGRFTVTCEWEFKVANFQSPS